MNENIQVGEFFYDIYGYDATLVDFYQVTRVVSEKTIEFRKVSRHYLSPEKVIPLKDDFQGDAHTRRKNKYGYLAYQRWNGQPKRISAFGTY